MSTETPDGLRYVVAKGGSKVHLLPQGMMKALCGHEPLSRYSRHMQGRAGWWLVDPEKRAYFRYDSETDTRIRTIPWCDKCQQARP